MNTQINLSENWTFKEFGSDNWMPAKVPGTVHLDLMANNIIEDPFYRKNEVNQQWIDKVDWLYSMEFELKDSEFLMENHHLVFEGLDTYAHVYLNGHKVLEADNMFCTWRVECTSFLQVGKNKLQIHFFSPIHHDLPQLARLGYSLPAVSDQSELGGLGNKRVSVFARKAPYQYGWDWGPRLITSGIWRPVFLECWNKYRIDDLHVVQESLNDSCAELTAVFEIESNSEGEIELSLDVDLEQSQLLKVSVSPGKQSYSCSFKIENPKRWWTNGLGSAHLYNITGSVGDGETLYESRSVQVGLRTLRVVRKHDDAGQSFYFELNGKAVFAKGANVIPQDSFVPRTSKDQTLKMIKAARDANMNMLRVWGGGIYESDYFYQLCDEHGILIWQDFMFACAHYPGDEAFLRSVQSEAEQNIKRLRNHACLAIWCGNNEIDMGWSFGSSDDSWGWKKLYSEDRLKKLESDYIRLFKHLLPDLIKTLDPSRFYWPSSPQADWDTSATYDSTSGDIHYWGVWHGQEPFENYNKFIGRFMSEYGFQSFPQMKSVKQYTQPEDWFIDSEVMRSHQRSEIGNRRIKSYMDLYFREPKDFESLIYLSQILQAEGIKTAIEAHRRRKPYCMGSLYWQLNDCWPVASWSSIDYYGRWKALHYAVKRAFNYVLVSPHIDNNSLFVDVISDLHDSIDAELLCTVKTFEGDHLWDESIPVQLTSNEAKTVFKEDIQSLTSGVDLSFAFLHTELKIDNRIISENTLYFTEYKYLNWPPPRIHWKIEYNNEGYIMILRSDQMAKSVFICTRQIESHFSDNYFDLLPGSEVRINVFTEADIEELRQDIEILTLWDSYSE